MARLRIDRITTAVGVLAIDGAVVFERCYLADDLLTRLIGLLGTRDLGPGEALLIPGCRSIHTLGMRSALDVAFIDQGWRIAAVTRDLAPGRFARRATATAVLETRSRARELEIGSVVSFQSQ